MKIKCLIASLMMLCLGYSASAQMYGGSAASTAGAGTVTYGLRVGYTSAKVSSEDLSTGAKGGFQIGGLLNYGVNEMFSIQPELLYIQKGGKMFGFEESFNYLEVPILAKIGFGDGSITGFATGGPTLGYLMSVNADGEDYEFQDEDNRLELGASFGVGAGYKLATGTLNLDVRYGLGLSNLYEEGDAKNRVFGISVAYIFGM